MKLKLLAFTLSLLLIGSLVLVSCQSAPATSTGTTVTGTATSTQTQTSTSTLPPNTVAPLPETAAPKYGGSITIPWNTDPLDFDQGYKSAWYSFTLDATNDTIDTPDWAKGPLGTDQIPLLHLDDVSSDLRTDITTGIASISQPDPLTIVIKLRQGLHFMNKPPVNGREVTSDDVITSIQRVFNLPGGWLYAYPNKPTSYTATDKYTVTLKFASFDPSLLHNRISETCFVIPKELVVDANGKETQALRDWHNSNGTGPFMLTDYLSGSSISFVKNPNYWQTDPLHPGNQLPYVDSLKVLIIPDLATRLAALRAGKVDTEWGITRQDAASLQNTNPSIKYATYPLGSVMAIWPNTTITPMNSLKVRQALSEAINRDEITKTLYNGQASLLEFWVPSSEAKAYTPFNQLPADTQALYTYNVTNAKKLLSDAGYPNGFTTQIGIDAADPTLNDLAPLIVNYWKAVGVTATIDAQAYPVYNANRYSHQYNGFFIASWANAAALWNNFDIFRTGQYSNWSVVSDPYWDSQSVKIASTLDETTRYQMVKDLNIYELNNVWAIPTPSFYLNIFWQPWMKGYNGVFYMGIYHYFKPFAYAWIDKSQ